MPANQAFQVEPSIQAVEAQFIRIASEQELVSWQKESQFAIQAIYQNPKLQQCSLVSIQNAVINVASVGLTLNPSSGYAYLVPEYNTSIKQNECQLRVSFKGLAKVAVDSGSVRFVRAEIVKTNDTFVYRGPCEKPDHDMEPFGDRGETIGVYCIAKTPQGDFLTDVMPKADIDKIRTKAKYDGVWQEWYDEMGKKALVKRASKLWPSSAGSERLDKTISIINDYEGSEPLNGQAVSIPANPANEPVLLEHYPQDQFDKYLPAWESQILQEGKSPERVIEFLQRKGVNLSPQQQQQIQQVAQ